MRVLSRNRDGSRAGVPVDGGVEEFADHAGRHHGAAANAHGWDVDLFGVREDEVDGGL